MSVKTEWAMQCPICGGDDKLDVVAIVSVRLTADGTDTDESSNGNHEWDEDSRCNCEGCGWSGKVRQAKKAFIAYDTPCHLV